MKIAVQAVFFLIIFTSIGIYTDDKALETIYGRSIGPLPQTDRRIDGYRPDYKKKKINHIQLTEKESAKIKAEEEQIRILKEKEKKKEQEKEQKHHEQQKVQKPAEPERSAPGYTGETVNGVREGKGRLVLENGDIYEGNWENGKKSGHGIYLFANGIKYNGNWSEDLMHGDGSLIFPDQSQYYGELKKGKITGYGMFIYADGAVYEGNWKDGRWHGEGCFKLRDGRSLKAVFADQQVVKILKEEEKDDTDIKTE